MERINNNIYGIILVNKFSGITSHDAVDIVRRRLGIRQVGHTGTLDPLAEGLLIMLVGKYTRLFQKFVGFNKEYLGALKLGETTTTADSQGIILKKRSWDGINDDQIRRVFSTFLGNIEQMPPMVSAIRINGHRLYRLARRGIVVKRLPRRIKIYKLDILKINIPLVEFYVQCSRGTYVRTLAEDVGEELGCGAHITKIKRLAIGPFKLEEAVNVEEVTCANLRKVTVSNNSIVLNSNNPI